MAFTPVSGTAGRVRVGAGSTAVSGISEWRINKQVAAVPYNHFELTADADGVVWSKFLAGLGNATCTVRGWYDTDGTTKTEGGTPGLRVGQAVTLDLLFDRTAPFGYLDLAALCTGFEAGTKIENSVADFTATFQINGAAAAAA